MREQAAVDPISTLLSAYLRFVSSDIAGQYSARHDVEIQSLNIEYEGIDIPFQHQVWKIRPDSVCAFYRDELLSFSKCTASAKRLFRTVCDHLSEKPIDHWKYLKTKNMYCNAAVSYQPTVAAISEAEKPAPLEAARQKCNLATAQALGRTDAASIAARTATCSAYEKLKQ